GAGRDEGGTMVTAVGIMRRFLDERGGRAVIPPALARRAFAETYVHLSLARRGRSRLAALQCLVKALGYAPGYLPAWKCLASLALPERGRRWLRQRLGRPVDWEVRARVAHGGAVGSKPRADADTQGALAPWPVIG